MFFPESRIRVFLWGQPTDMRKSFDGLYTLARSGFAVDPLQGHLFVFANRRGTWRHVTQREIDPTALKMLLEGIEPTHRYKRYCLLPAEAHRARC